MRLVKVPLILIEDHVINLKLLASAYIEETDDYPKKWMVRYYMDLAYNVEDNDGETFSIEFKTRKAAVEALAKITAATDTVMIEETE